MTDYAWACYVADLAVCGSSYGEGGRAGLMAEVRRQLGPGVMVLLVAVAEAVGFHKRIGMEPTKNAFWSGDNTEFCPKQTGNSK
jgi:hypothetical protein